MSSLTLSILFLTIAMVLSQAMPSESENDSEAIDSDEVISFDAIDPVLDNEPLQNDESLFARDHSEDSEKSDEIEED